MKKLEKVIEKNIARLDSYTLDHSRRVADLIVKLADYLGYDQEKKNYLLNAALVHDIGKRYVPEKILNKSGKLGPEEFIAMKDHTVNGYKHCLKEEGLIPYADIVRSHHERIDGKGYPDGLKGEQISHDIKALSIIDTYEAITASNRPYREPLTYEDAKELIIKETEEGKFDPELVKSVLEMLDLERDFLLR